MRSPDFFFAFSHRLWEYFALHISRRKLEHLSKKRRSETTMVCSTSVLPFSMSGHTHGVVTHHLQTTTRATTTTTTTRRDHVALSAAQLSYSILPLLPPTLTRQRMILVPHSSPPSVAPRSVVGGQRRTSTTNRNHTERRRMLIQVLEEALAIVDNGEDDFVHAHTTTSACIPNMNSSS